MSSVQGLVSGGVLIAGVVLFVLVAVPIIVSKFLRNVEAGEIRLVSWLAGGTKIYRGPGKSKEIPLLTTGTTISSKVINVDLDITDQTADIDENGTPRPIKVRVLASAIVTPIWNFTFRFASNPALTLESSLMSEATAVTSFDVNGQGLIAIEVDGQLVQLLGTLNASDRALRVRVPAGARLRVEDVDAARNRCSVSLL